MGKSFLPVAWTFTVTVNHYNGPVTCSSEGFLEKNQDALNPEFVSLLRGHGNDGPAHGTEGTDSVNTFIHSLFSGKAIATQVYSRDEDTIVAARQTVKPMRAPSTRRKGTIKRNNRLGAGGGKEEKEDDDARLLQMGSLDASLVNSVRHSIPCSPHLTRLSPGSFSVSTLTTRSSLVSLRDVSPWVKSGVQG